MNQTPIPALVQLVMPAALNSGLFKSRCTIQQPSGTYGPSGAPDGNFTTVFSNIECMDAPPSTARVQATEVKALAEIMAKGLRHVLLSGYFPSVVAGVAAGWRAIVDGITYDILGGEVDSQRSQTRLELQLIGV